MKKYAKVARVLWIILFLNLAVAAIKIVVGSIINSASMTADGFHSITDGTSNIIGLIGIMLASKPEDEAHPYGHKKFETLAGLIIAGMLFILAVRIIVAAVLRFSDPAVLNITTASLAALVITLVINILVATLEYKEGQKLQSDILISDSLHTRSDIYISCGVLAALLGIKLGLPPVIDSVVSLIVAIFVIHAAVEVFVKTSGVLVDKSTINTDKVEEIVLSFPQAKSVHNIRSRGKGDDIYIDLHVMTDPEMKVDEAHSFVHDIEQRLKEILQNDSIETIIHLEPYPPADGCTYDDQ